MSGLLVTEWIESVGGAEKVLDRAAGLFSDAQMLCLWNDAPRRHPGRKVRETWLARTPLRHHKALALPVMPLTWRIPRHLSGDWALVFSHAFAHHVRFTDENMPTFVYVHTPARYLWAPELDGRGDNLAARIASPPLRAIDRRTARRATALAANSRFVAKRVERAWGAEASVIHPPVEAAYIGSGAWRGLLSDSERRTLDALPEQFVLGVSRFIPYKRLDIVVEAGEALGLPVVLAGFGPLEAELREVGEAAKVPVHVEVAPSDAMIFALMERASLFVFPPVEDFGIVAVEAMAAGTPVIANRVGGASESIDDGVGGALFDPRSRSELVEAATRSFTLPRERILQQAMQFDAAEFDHRLLTWMTHHGADVGASVAASVH
ncbi:glycosyltransferase [Microbacterium sp. E-13]|uniref:glycosyltransferase n=1 Tax=Microbacterium sp. E-13 TaxID=3404048 RepID=UPI003CE9A113